MPLSSIMMSWRCHSHGISGWVPPWWPPPRSPGGGSHSWTLAPCLTHNSERQREVEDAAIKMNHLQIRAVFPGPKAGHLVLKEWLLTTHLGDKYKLQIRSHSCNLSHYHTTRLHDWQSPLFFIRRKAHHHCTAVNNTSEYRRHKLFRCWWCREKNNNNNKKSWDISQSKSPAIAAQTILPTRERSCTMVQNVGDVQSQHSSAQDSNG